MHYGKLGEAVGHQAGTRRRRNRRAACSLLESQDLLVEHHRLLLVLHWETDVMNRFNVEHDFFLSQFIALSNRRMLLDNY